MVRNPALINTDTQDPGAVHLDVPQAEGEAQIEPDRVPDDLRREAVTDIVDGLQACILSTGLGRVDCFRDRAHRRALHRA
jgi:hypothetical protein